MKMKLIQTKDYLLLIDEEAEIKRGDYLLEKESIINVFPNYLTDLEECKKIIAYYPINSEAKELDLPLLPNPFKNSKVELAKLQSEYSIIQGNGLEAGTHFGEGYKAAQQSNKQFSLEDMKKAMFEVYKNGIRNPKEGKESFGEISNRVIQSLSTQQLPKEFIPELVIISNDEVYFDKQLKTITNFQGKQELAGKYKW